MYSLFHGLRRRGGGQPGRTVFSQALFLPRTDHIISFSSFLILMTMAMQNSLFKLTASREDLEATFRLLHVAYVESGIAYPNPQRLRATPYHLFPSTEVAVAAYPGQVACTATLVRDGPMGLPMERVYGQEVQQRRARGLSLAEISCLAHAQRPATRYFQHVLGVMSLVAQAARSRGVEQLLLTAHPRHVRFYSRYLGCDVIGGLTRYETVCYQPAVAMCLDMVRLAERHPQGYAKLFGTRHPADALRPKPKSRAVVQWIADLLESNGQSVARFAGPAAVGEERAYTIRGPWPAGDIGCRARGCLTT